MNASGHLRVYPTPEAVANAFAEHFVASATRAFADRGRFVVALAGGNTPRAAYELLATQYNDTTISWNDVFVYFGDERCVPPTDEQSNYRMASKTLLSRVNIPSANVHRMRGEIDPADAAREYAQEITQDLGAHPEFDLVLLGMGTDGHTASLFPGTDPMTDSSALVRAVFADSVGSWRLTLTPDIFNAARIVIVATEGYEKAEALAAVREGRYDPKQFPAQIIAPTEGRLIWLVDEAAANNLKER